MSTPLSFQDIILRLLSYWKDEGCLVQQPYHVQVGAGTMNPATALRVLGPEPWNVVYVEPSIRPDDGRFGDNPNRMQMHHQLQVILKPDPGNPQERYLKSLEAIGIDPRQHDIRFVEDNWESPALGAWGLGWEVWLDGQEITQFTYFQQAGGQPLDPVSVEITYGLDRIALALQGMESVWSMEYGAGIPYGDVLLASEIEHCRYYFEVADVEALKAVYDTYEREAKRCLEAHLVFPAHDYNLKCSHLFNVLDTRGAIGVTERANYFRRMRNVTRDVSALYVAQRQEQDYPLLHRSLGPEHTGDVSTSTQTEEIDSASNGPHPFVLEIGSEELPATDLTSALEQLRTAVPALLRELRLDYNNTVEVQGTPRRLVVFVPRLARRQPNVAKRVKGPPANRAFDSTGRPTEAALGFARSRGVDVTDLQVIEDKSGRYVVAEVHETGRSAIQALAEALPGLIASVTFGKSMRWNHTNVSYSRPLRWFVALYGTQVVPFTYAGVASGRTSRGLRPYGSPPITIDDAANYTSIMQEHNIVTSVEKRQEIITKAAEDRATRRGGIYRGDSDLLEEVANLVEYPTVLGGRFDERFLALPAEVLVAVMKKHQRYFPVYAADGRLLPYFITVRNGDDRHLGTVAAGNEQVLRARFADAEFFHKHDTQYDLTAFVPRLATLTFQAQLGSMLDKVQRLEQLTPAVARLLGLPAEEIAVAREAAYLSKADLATRMVVEMTSLQGIMGGHYARLNGKSDAVATALAEQYNPVSTTRPGLALALADRLDSLLGLFAVGLAPKGSNDPFALRRAALGVIENLIANQVSFDIRAALAEAARLLPVPSDTETIPAVLTFMNGRMEGILRERGIPAAVVRAVLAEQGHNPYAASQSASALAEAITAPDWQAVLESYSRCVRITRQLRDALTVHPEALTMPAEKTLWVSYQAAAASQDGTVAQLVAALRNLVPAITTFFIDVLVMDEDMAVRNNRLALLQHIASLPKGIVDLSYLEGF
jgi:glycyl-tRNA synthetase